MALTCSHKFHHLEKVCLHVCLSLCVLTISAQLDHLASYDGCTDVRNELTRELDGLLCSFDHMFEMQALLPPIRMLELSGVGSTRDQRVVQWVTSHLELPELLEILTVRFCGGIHIGENDLANLQHLKELSISFGSLDFLHPRAFSNLTYLQSVTLKSLGIRLLPNALTGHLDSSYNDTDMWLPRLQNLDLSGNDIPDIPEDTFLRLRNLQFLDLAQNKLWRLNAEPFKHLESLVTLNVGLNLISALPSNGFAGVLPNLQNLIMQSNSIFDLRMNSFAGLKRLQTLDISMNPIQTLHPQALQGLDSLQEINFLYNPLQSVPRELLQPVNSTLRKINLGECKLSSIPKGFFEELPELEFVDLSKNAISSLQNISFQDNSKLQTLNISSNCITNIPPYFFNKSAPIKIVQLERNSINHLPTGTFSNLRNLQVINMSMNNLTTLSKQSFYNLPSLRVLDLSWNLLRRIPLHALYNIPDLKKLNLEGNRLTNFPELPQVNRDAFNVQGHPDKAVEVDIRHNRLWCDCDMYDLINDFEYSSIWPGANLLANQRFTSHQELICSWPPPVINKNLDQLITSLKTGTGGLFLSNARFFCPDFCQCYTSCINFQNIMLCNNAHLTSVPQNLSEDINFLDLTNNDLGKIPASSFAHIKHLAEIYLSGNHIAEIGNMFAGLSNLNTIYLGQNNVSVVSRENFKDLSNLRELDLHQNSISVIEPGSFADLSKLRTLKLDHNLMTGLKWEVLNSTISLTTLTLNNNPFICNCDVKWLKDWLQTHADVVENVDSVNCTTLENKTGAVVYFEDDEFLCDTKEPTEAWTMQIVAVCLGVLLFLMCIVAVLYRFRKRIQVIVYNNTGLRFPNKADRDSANTYLYDAFISFSSEDLNFVIQELVPKLENHQPPFKLCIHQRDFAVAECISTNIVNAVESSRRTIVVLTNNFVRSEWCSFEFKAAHQQLLKDDQNRLIVILLEEVDRNTLDKDLKLYLSTNTYLERKDSLFWKKLYYAMPDKKVLDQRTQEQNIADGENDASVQMELQEDLQQLIT